MKIIKIDKDKIEFDNGYILTYHHDQDCCEHVYADFENMQINNPFITEAIDIMNYEFDKELLDNINLITDVGFELVTTNGTRILVSCYNCQNGYYSSDLELILMKNNNIKETIDISNNIKDDIFLI